MLLEKGEWEQALVKLNRSRTVYDELSHSAEGVEQAMYRKR